MQVIKQEEWPESRGQKISGASGTGRIVKTPCDIQPRLNQN